MFLSSKTRYGILAIVAHWLTALLVITLFALGLWMVTLDYYHPWYKQAPSIHKSIGILLVLLVGCRLLLRLFSPVPDPVPGIKRWERTVSVIVHWLMYMLLIVTCIFGYLISTADGRSISVFGIFEIPAITTGISNQEDIAGELHLYFAVTLISLAGVHALAAFKHHFIDRDTTLLRMFGKGD